MADVFISYKRNDRARVEDIAKALEEVGLSVWFDSRLELGAFQGFDQEIEREVNSAAAVLVCWTQDAVKSVYVRAESKKGLERDALVPVFLEMIALPVPFNDIDTVNLSDWNGNRDDIRWQRILARVRQLADKAKADRPALMQAALRAISELPPLLYPSTLQAIIPKLDSNSTVKLERYRSEGEMVTSQYHDDIKSTLEWIMALAKDEERFIEKWYRDACTWLEPESFWENNIQAKDGELGRRRRVELQELTELLKSVAATVDALRSAYAQDAFVGKLKGTTFADDAKP